MVSYLKDIVFETLRFRPPTHERGAGPVSTLGTVSKKLYVFGARKCPLRLDGRVSRSRQILRFHKYPDTCERCLKSQSYS